MKHFILSIIFVLFSISLFSQYSISGITIDEHKAPIQFVAVALYDNSENLITGTETDFLGNFIFKNLTKGTYLIEFSYVGKTTLRLEEVLIINKNVDLKKISLKKNTLIINPIIVSSPWLDIKDPYAYTNLNKQAIEDKNQGQDVPYLLQDLSSVVITSDAGAGVGYSGIRVRGSDPTRVNVTINGIPFNDSESQGTYWVDLPDFAGSVESIQLHKGVGPSVVGAGAFGATLNLDTKASSADKGVSYSGTYGSFNTLKNAISASSGKLKNGFAINGRLSLITSDGYIDRASSNLKSAFLGLSYLKNKNSFKFNIFAGHEITYQAWNGVPIQYVSDHDKRTYNSAGTDKDGQPYEDEVDNYKQTHYQAFYTRSINPKWHLKLALHYTKGYGYYENYKGDKNLSSFGISPIINGLDTISRSDVVRRKYLDNDFFGIIPTIQYDNDHLSLTIGGGWNQYLGNHYGEIINIIKSPSSEVHEYYRNKAKKNDTNTFVKLNFRLANNLNIYTDLQTRYINYNYEGKDDSGEALDKTVQHLFFNPKFGLKYGNRNFTSYFSISHGSKEPSRSDYIDASANEIPKAETMIDYELGIQYNKRNLSLRTNLYYMDYKNQLVLTGRLNDVGEYVRSNVLDSYRAGVEIEGEYYLSFMHNKGLKIQGNLALSNNKIKNDTLYLDNWDTYIQRKVELSDKSISFSPKIVSGINFSYQAYKTKKNALVIDFSEKYVGSQYLDNTEDDISKLDGYFNENASIAYNRVFKRINATLKLSVNNIFDRKYSSNGWIYRFDSPGYNPVAYDPSAVSNGTSNYALIGLYPQAGRYFLLSLNVSFK